MRVLIVDDEPLARRGLRDFLAAEPDLSLAGECQNGIEALEAIPRLRPDLVLLDVQMPGVNGFEVLEQLEGHLPLIIFVTAFDRYALKAFDVHAVDYLLKPVEQTRFRRALAEARQRLQAGRLADAGGRVLELLGALGRTGRRRFVVKSGGRMRLVSADEVRWIEAAGNYVRLHTADGRFSVRQTMQDLEATLDPATFVRIHRSYIVNLDAVREIQHWVRDELQVILKDGRALPLSRSSRAGLERRLEETR